MLFQFPLLPYRLPSGIIQTLEKQLYAVSSIADLTLSLSHCLSLVMDDLVYYYATGVVCYVKIDLPRYVMYDDRSTLQYMLIVIIQYNN